MPTNDIIGNWLGCWSMDSFNWKAILFRLAAATVLAAIAGSDRAAKRHSAGMRTFILTGLASVIVAECDKHGLSSRFPLLSGAFIVGLATISCNMILFSSKNQLKGLTTSVCLWTTGCLSLCIGFGLYTVALLGFLAQLASIALLPALERFIKKHSTHFEIHLELKNRNLLQDFVDAIRQFGLHIDNLEFNPSFANTGMGVYSLQLTASGQAVKGKSHTELIEALSALNCVHFIEELE